MLNLVKLLQISFYIILFFSCQLNTINKCESRILGEGIRIKDDLESIKAMIPDIMRCFECSEDEKVFFHSKSPIIIDSVSNNGINRMNYYHFNSYNQLEEIELVYIFSSFKDKKEMKKNEMLLLKNELKNLEEFASIDENKLIKFDNCNEYKYTLDTTSIYPILKLSVQSIK